MIVKALIKENMKATHHWPLWGEFTSEQWIPPQRTSNTENVSIWWCHHVSFIKICKIKQVVVSVDRLRAYSNLYVYCINNTPCMKAQERQKRNKLPIHIFCWLCFYKLKYLQSNIKHLWYEYAHPQPGMLENISSTTSYMIQRLLCNQLHNVRNSMHQSLHHVQWLHSDW